MFALPSIFWRKPHLDIARQLRLLDGGRNAPSDKARSGPNAPNVIERRQSNLCPRRPGSSQATLIELPGLLGLAPPAELGPLDRIVREIAWAKLS